MKHRVEAFIRVNGEGSPETIALIEFTLTKNCPETEALTRFKQILKAWVKETKKGQRAYEDSSKDFNIGDVSLNEESMLEWVRPRLRQAGIQDFLILFCGDVDSNQVHAFDEQLIEED